MDAFEYDPEGTTLRELERAIPDIVPYAQRQLTELDQARRAAQNNDIPIGTNLDGLMPRSINIIARAYNNLMAIYGQRFPRLVAPTRVLFVSVTQRHDIGVCPEHLAAQIAAYQQREHRFAVYTNDFAAAYDCPAGQMPVPRLPNLKAVVRMFESYIEYRKTIRVCEVIRATRGMLLVLDREFSTVDHYERALSQMEAQLTMRRAAISPVPLCVSCSPCIATLMFCMLGGVDDAKFKMRYPDTFEKEFFMAEPRPGAALITSDRVARACKADVQNAMLWYFAGVCGPSITLFEVATQLREPNLRASLALVQDVAVYCFLAFKSTPHEAKRKQQAFILPALKRRQLYDAVSDVVIAHQGDFTPV